MPNSKSTANESVVGSSRLEALAQAVAHGDLDHREPDGTYPVTELGRLRAEALVYRHGNSVAIEAFHRGKSYQKVVDHMRAVEKKAEEAREWRVVTDA